MSASQKSCIFGLKSRPGVKFMYSEKATTFWEISTVDLTVATQDKSMVEISQKFVAFSECMNFTSEYMNFNFLGSAQLLIKQEAPGKHPGSTHHFLQLNENLQHFGYFSRKHPGSTHGFFLDAAICDIIDRPQCMQQCCCRLCTFQQVQSMRHTQL